MLPASNLRGMIQRFATFIGVAFEQLAVRAVARSAWIRRLIIVSPLNSVAFDRQLGMTGSCTLLDRRRRPSAEPDRQLPGIRADQNHSASEGLLSKRFRSLPRTTRLACARQCSDTRARYSDAERQARPGLIPAPRDQVHHRQSLAWNPTTRSAMITTLRVKPIDRRQVAP